MSNARGGNGLHRSEQPVPGTDQRKLVSGRMETSSTIPTPAEPQWRKGVRIVRRAIYIIIMILGLLYTLDPYNNIIGIREMRKAYALSQEVILDELMTPRSAIFPKFKPEFVTQRTKIVSHEGIEYRVHTVSAYVDADNLFGVSVRQKYVVEIGFPEDSSVDGYYYRLISIE